MYGIWDEIGDCVVDMFFDIYECMKLFLMNYENVRLRIRHEKCFHEIIRALLIIYEVLQHQIKNGECVVVMFFDIHECVKLFLMNYENF